MPRRLAGRGGRRGRYSLPAGPTGSVVPDSPGGGGCDAVVSVSPAYGATAGGTSVTITVENAVGDLSNAVYFDASLATGVTVVSPTSITCTTPAGSGSVTVSVADKSLGNAFIYAVLYLNKPGGFTELATSYCDQLPSTGAGSPLGGDSRNTGIFGIRENNSGSWGLATGTGPVSSNLWRWNWPNELTAGYSPGSFKAWIDTPEPYSADTAYDEYYLSFYYRFNDDHDDGYWHGHSGGVKMGQPGGLDTNVGNNVVVSVYPTSTNANDHTFRTGPWTQGTADDRDPPFGNVAEPDGTTQRPIIVGQWHLIELYCKLNTPVASSNGILRYWVDGELLFDDSTLRYRDSDGDRKFWTCNWFPTWGGGGGSLNRAQTSDMNFFSIWGKKV